MNSSGSTREAMLEEFRKKQLAPPDELELGRRRASGKTMDRLRVGVGKDFDVAGIVREGRDRMDGKLPDHSLSD